MPHESVTRPGRLRFTVARLDLGDAIVLRA
jgi:hypothetical protein